jgi:hypothetical protein
MLNFSCIRGVSSRCFVCLHHHGGGRDGGRFAVTCTAGLSAAEFFRSIDDLPLAPGLTEVVEEGVEFDSPAGRIVTAVAAGDVRSDTVIAFYRKALPPLGWSKTPGGAYHREGEVLTLRLESGGKAVKLMIRVVPAQPNMAR